MLRVAQDKEEIIIRELPIGSWIGAAAIIVVLSVLVGYLYFSEATVSQIWLVVFCGGAFISIFQALLSPLTTIRINKPGQTVAVRKQSLFTYSFKVYSFSEIADVISVETVDGGRGTKLYQLVMPLKNGERIELSTPDGSKRSQYYDAVSLISPYMFESPPQIPFKLTILEDD